jgi:hypothetical protein
MHSLADSLLPLNSATHVIRAASVHSLTKLVRQSPCHSLCALPVLAFTTLPVVALQDAVAAVGFKIEQPACMPRLGSSSLQQQLVRDAQAG